MDLDKDELKETKENRFAGLLTIFERNYLKNVIQPFRDRVIYIKKAFSWIEECEYVEIGIKSLDSDPENYIELVELYTFEKNTQYKKLEFEKEYDIKELEL